MTGDNKRANIAAELRRSDGSHRAADVLCEAGLLHDAIAEDLAACRAFVGRVRMAIASLIPDADRSGGGPA